MAEPDEQSLLDRLSEGDSNAFWSLWEMHEKHLFAVCLKHVGVKTDAEDALSRAMLRAKDKLTGRVWEIKNLRAWLTTLTYHVCMDIHRERARDKSELESLERMRAGGTASETYAESPESSFTKAEFGERLRTLINALPAKLREPFTLRFLHELEYAEIAERLGLTPATVRKRIQLARMKLKEQLDKET